MMDLSTATDFFDANYRVGGTSGEGSTAAVSTTYRAAIEEFVRLNGIRSVLEIGCGDWTVSRLIPWGDYDVSYTGLDVSPFIIDRNNQNYGNAKTRFQVARSPDDILSLGRFDLIISKDAMQHMPNAVIEGYLAACEKAARFSILTNDTFPPHMLNEDIAPGEWRALDLRKPPFSRPTAVLAEYVTYHGEELPGYERRPITFFVKHLHLLKGPA